MQIVFVNGSASQTGDVITVTGPVVNTGKWESDKEVVTDITIDSDTGDITSMTKQKIFFEINPLSLS